MLTKFLLTVFVSTFGISVWGMEKIDEAADSKDRQIYPHEEYFLGSDDTLSQDEFSIDSAYDRPDEKSLTPTEKRLRERECALEKMTYHSIEWKTDAFDRNSSRVTSEEECDEQSSGSEISNSSLERKSAAYNNLCILPELTRGESFSTEAKDEQLKVNVGIASLQCCNAENKSITAYTSWFFCSVSPRSPSCRKSHSRETILRTISGTLIAVN